MELRSYRCGPAIITLDDHASVVSVIHDQHPTQTWLVGGGVPEVVIDGQPLVWTVEQIAEDVDEVEIESSSWPVSATVRHTFMERWGVRLTLNNLSDEPVLIDSASLSWRSDPRRAAWALAAGAAGAYAIPSLDACTCDAPFPDPAGPLLGGVLASGVCAAVDDDALRSGPVTLAPGGLFVLQWNWEWYDSPADFTAARHRDVPWTGYLQAGDSIRIEADADTAVVVTGDGVVEEEGSIDEVVVAASAEGDFTVELSSARGTTRYLIHVSQHQEVLVSRAADRALRGPVTAAGVVKLPDVHSALAVQQALLGAQVDDPVTAEDALELFIARRLEDSRADALLISLAATEAERTGEEETLRAAIRWWAAPAEFTPGLGLALSPLCLAAVAAGASSPRQPEWWGRLASASDEANGPIAWAVELEQLMIGGLHPSGTETKSRQLRAAQAVGSWLGAGLKGEAVRRLPAADIAYLATVLPLCGEQLSTPLEQSWAHGTADVVVRAQAEVRWRVADHPAGAALAWLILAGRVP